MAELKDILETNEFKLQLSSANTLPNKPTRVQLDAVLAETSNDWRFYPIADGWGNNPTLVETLIGANATLVNGLESNWDDFVVTDNGEPVTHNGEVITWLN